jgi:hypothetical protein
VNRDAHPSSVDTGRSGTRCGARVLIFDNWVARPPSTGHGRCRALRKEPATAESRQGPSALDGALG